MREFEGNDLDEAIGAASAALGLPASEFSFEMVDEGRRGVFGLGARQVRIRVTEISGDEIRPPTTEAVEAPPPPPVPQAPAGARERGRPAPDRLVETVERMLDLMGYRAEAEAIAHDGGWTIRVGGADRKLLVKRDGEVLDAMEFLLNRMGRRAWPEAGSVRVACAGFRDRRDEEIISQTRAVASSVARSGQPERLHEMNPYERRLVHLTVREFPGIVSRSEGEGFLKRVRVEKANE